MDGWKYGGMMDGWMDGRALFVKEIFRFNDVTVIMILLMVNAMTLNLNH